MSFVRGLSACALGLAIFSAREAAADFDATTGKLTLGGAFSSGLDSQGSVAITAATSNESQVAASVVAARFQNTPNALEGSGAFFLGGDVYIASIDFSSVTSLAGRRVDIRFWQRPGSPTLDTGTWAEAYLTWHSSGIETAILRFMPTGRGTSDGWREYASGPIDFMLGNKLFPTMLLRDGQLTNTTLDPGAQNPVPGFELGTSARVAIDALEIDDLGNALAPNVTCESATTSQTCGAGAACYGGRCVDAAAVFGGIPESQDEKNAYIARAQFGIHTFEGSRYAAANVSVVDSALATSMTTNDPNVFWAGFRALKSLHDAHSSPPSSFYTLAVEPGICLGIGAADLLPSGDTTTPVMMVYQTDTSHSAAALVEPGDVLTAIDGLPVATWLAQNDNSFYTPGDPRTNFLYESQILPEIASELGSKLTFSRCDRNSHSTIACAAGEVTTIDIDLAAIASSKIWNNALTDADLMPINCDPRFSRPIAGDDTYDYAYAGFVDLAANERILMINGVPAEDMEGGESWKSNVASAVSVPRSMFLLDERQGGGGWSVPAYPLLFGSLFSGAVPIRAESLPNLESDALEPSLAAMRACWSPDLAASYTNECAGYFEFAYDGTGFSTNNATSKLAVLAGIDVSGNDYLTRMIRTRTGPTRIFGITSTMGGFGSIMFLPTYGYAPVGGSLQIQDGFFTTSDSDPTRNFESGTGVMPDEIDLEKQSDAINQIDTLYQAARTWVEAP